MFVDIDEVIAEAVSILGYGEDDEMAKNFARQWVWSAKKKLGTSDKSIQVCKIYAKNLLLKKPKNIKQTIELSLWDANGNYIPHQFHSGNTRIYPNVDQYTYSYVENEGTDDEETITYYLPVDLSETDSAYVIGTNGTMVDYALVRYYPLPLDANNLPQVYEHEVDAIKFYIKWQWSMRRNENQSEIAQNEMRWKQEADWAKAHGKMMDFTNEVRKKIAATTNKMIPNFNRSQF
jgi:hypothetical protein